VSRESKQSDRRGCGKKETGAFLQCRRGEKKNESLATRGIHGELKKAETNTRKRDLDGGERDQLLVI